MLLERVAIGDAPFGTHIYEDELRFRKCSLNLMTSSAEEVVSFFTDAVGLALQYVYFESWKDIKRKVIRDNLIQDFVLRVQQRFELPSHETNRLFSMIHLYVTLKKIQPHEIVLETYPHTHIKTIHGLMVHNKRVSHRMASEQQHFDLEEDEEDGGPEDDVMSTTAAGDLPVEEDDDSE